MTTVQEAWKSARAARPARRRRTPLLLAFAGWAGRKLPTWKKARTGLMQWGAFGAGDAALFGVDWRWGLAGVFVSLLVLEALGGSER